jgi:threonine dehydrogenase-like Zn-dependent dehydrogenase
MEKQLTMRGGQTPVQKYWNLLLDKVQAGQLHPDMVITHVMPLEQVAKGYELFNDKKDGCVKVVLKTAAAEAAEAPAGPGVSQQ